MTKDILVMYSNLEPTAEHVDRLRRLAPGREVVVAGSETEALNAAPGCEVFLGHRYCRQCLPGANALKWIQSTAAGVDALVTRDLLERDVRVSRSPIASKTVAHHALAMAWALLRRIPDAARFQPERDWSWRHSFAETPRKALVLGVGAIGRELARLLRALGVTVIGVCRTATAGREAACDELIAGSGWRAHLAEADLVFIALPRTRDTRGYFDAPAIDALPEHAVLVDVGRAGTLDVAHAMKRLGEGRLLGLGLDAVNPADFGDDFDWYQPGLLVTPKIAAFSKGRQADLEAYVEAQLERYLAGSEPLNLVSRDDLEAMLTD